MLLLILWRLMMRIVNQVNDLDCGIACAAMFSGYNYMIAFRLDLLLESNKKRGLSQKDMVLLLSKLTRDNIKNKRVDCFLSDLPDRKSVALIRESRGKYGHWICLEDGLVFDPELNSPVKIQDYLKRDFRAVCVLSAANSGSISTHL